MTVKEKAINIAIGTYLSEWEGDAVDVFNKMMEEESSVNFSDIDYAMVWEPFEYESVESVACYMNILVENIVESLREKGDVQGHESIQYLAPSDQLNLQSDQNIIPEIPVLQWRAESKWFLLNFDH